MKCKKIVSLLLAVIMVLGILPVGAMAAEPTQIGTSATGEFADITADPNKTYEYTITGSDGSIDTIVVPAVNADPTGNRLEEQTTAGAVYYQKVTDPASASGDGYLLVDGATSQAVSTRPGVEGVNIQGDRIIGDHATAEWTVGTSPNKISFATGTKRLTIAQTKDGSGEHGWIFFPDDPWKNFRYSVEVSGKTDNFEPILSGDSFQLFRDYNERAFNDDPNKMVPVYLNIEGTRVMGDKNADHASNFTLYQRQTETALQYIVNTEGLDKLLAMNFTENLYTEDSWRVYAEAKAAAQDAVKKLNNPYSDRNAAEEALAAIDSVHRSLDAAIKGLVKKASKPVEPGTCVSPEITWHRTWEYGAGREKPVLNVSHLIDQDPWMDITWDWNEIKGLTASNPNPWDAPNGHAATWDKEYTGNWTDSSVRRFSGSFIWPEGVGMDGEIVLQSVNDAQYQFIYDYIDRDPELKERYGNAKVLPINDDMYVFISKASDGDPTTWTPNEARRHLAFWTGTTGKGIWSASGNIINDWGRTTPARFQGTSATPAYHGSWPNLVDRGSGSNANVQNWDLMGQPNPMTHTDSWYTLTDTNALKSKLNELYGATADLGGEEMRIDIYAFDNSESGGMDELQLILCAAEQTTAQVQVNYWLDQVGAVGLGSSVMTKKIGETVNLPKGTNSNELDYKLAEAIRIAGQSADVSNGQQQQKDFVVRKNGNVIDVVYTRVIKGVTYYTYDFGVENKYIFEDNNKAAIKGVSVECVTDTIDAAYDGHQITLTYTPKDASGSFINASLLVERGKNTNRYEIGIIPASNVLYEEAFIRHEPMNNRVAWREDGRNTFGPVTDNGETVYGYTNTYGTSLGANGLYTADVTADNRYTDELKFSFRGLGLDLIGSCGPDYGTLAVKIMQGTKLVKSYMIDTSYSGGVLDQVPLLHLQSGLETGKQYDVTITGVYLAAKPTPAALSVMGSGSAVSPEIYEALSDLGLTDEQIMETEFIGMEDVLKGSDVSVFSAAPAAGAQRVSVDSFRVYRSTQKASMAFAKNEQNVTYTNVMDGAIQGEFTAYVEDNGDGVYTVANYEGAGGPENELYLTPGNGVSFRLNTAALGAGVQPYAQVSLRAVTGPTQANNTIELTHNTEMYYEVAVENGMVTVTNTSSRTSGQMLAIGNIKTNCPLQKFDADAEARAVRAVMAFFAAPEEEVFEPEKLTCEMTVKERRRSVEYNLTVYASPEVDTLTINGKTVKPKNKRNVQRGKEDAYLYKFTLKTQKDEAPVFEIVAYDADGLASKPLIVQ